MDGTIRRGATAGRSGARRRGPAEVLAVWLAAASLIGYAGPSGSGAAQAPDGVAVAEADEVLLTLDHALYGTVGEQRDARFLQYVSEQDHLAHCFRGAGQTYPVPAFDDLLVGLTGELPTTPTPATKPVSESDAQRAGFHVAQRFVVVWKSLRIVNTPVGRSAAWFAAFEACASSTQPPAPAATGTDLATTWSMELAALSRTSGADAAIAATYPACMRRAGWGFRTPDEADEAVRSEFSPFGLPGGPAVPDSTEWSHAVTHERAIAAADAGCRKDPHALVAEMAGRAAADFLTRNADQLYALRRDRAATSADAATARTAWYGDHPELPRT